MKRRRCAYCDKKIKLMTPPRDGTSQYCCELCRKADLQEITPEQRAWLASASIQKSTTENR